MVVLRNLNAQLHTDGLAWRWLTSNRNACNLAGCESKQLNGETQPTTSYGRTM